MEVFRQPDIEQQPQPDRHIAVTAEVEIDLERVGEGGLPTGEKVTGGVQKSRICHLCKEVGEQDLFGHAEGKEVQTGGDVAGVRTEAIVSVKLTHHLIRQHDRTGDQLGEEADEQGITAERIAFCQRPGINQLQERDLLEGEEADPQRQQNVLEQKRGLEYGIDIFNKEVVILEVSQQQNVADDPDGQDDLRLLFIQQLCEKPVHQQGAAEDQGITPVEPGVKDKGRQHQPDLRCDPAPAGKQKIHDHGQGQKTEKKCKSRKKHQCFLCSLNFLRLA